MKKISPNEFDNAVAKERRGRKAKYDYDLILDGAPRVFTQGEDFTCEPTSFYTSVRIEARSRGIDAKVRVKDDQVYVWAAGDNNGV